MSDGIDLDALRDNLPAHYSDCDSFQVYNYGTRQGRCDCTASADIPALIAEVDSSLRRRPNLGRCLVTEGQFDLVPCKVCRDKGFVPSSSGGVLRAVDCPCTYRRPCDLLCRCSGGPL